MEAPKAEIMTAVGPDQALNSIFFLGRFLRSNWKTKRTGYESGEYEMVCCLCVDGIVQRSYPVGI